MRYNASFVQESSPKPWLKASSLLLMASVSFASYGVGLGKLTVNSYLNQPMNAEIRLLNVGSTPLSGIKVKIADTNEFVRVGMERAYVLGKLSFNVIRNKKHQPVIKITSQQRIDEPFIQFLLDVAWADGQFYRAYTVLLDPPGYIAAEESPKPKTYRVKSSLRRGKSVMDKQIDAAIAPDEQQQTDTQVALYGPVRGNEDIWQIARRYKSPDVTIQQTILAIVGTNPSAFSQGNLNGLKTGVKLSIPGRQIIAKVSSEKAPLEIMAHDAAWRDKKPIAHVLQPPYTGSTESSKSQLKPYTSTEDAVQKSQPGIQPQAQQTQSVVVNPVQKTQPVQKPKPSKAPKQQSIFDDVLSFSGGLLDSQPEKQVNPQKAIVEKSQNKEQVATNNLKASVAVIQSLEKANSLLNQQLNELKKQNKLLTKRVTEQEQEMQQLRKQLADFQLKAKEILTRASVAGQQSEAGSSSLSLGYYLLLAALLFIGLVGAGLGYFYYRQQQQQPEAELEEPTLHLPEDDNQDNNDLLAAPQSEIDEDEEDEDDRGDNREGGEENSIDIDDKPKIHPAIETEDQSQSNESQSTVVETYVEKEPEVEFDADAETKSKMQEAASKPSPEQLAKMVEAHRHQERGEQDTDQDKADDVLNVPEPQPTQAEQSDEHNDAGEESVESEGEQQQQKESEEEFILEFEDGLSKELTAEKESEEPQEEESEEEDEFTLEFEPTSVEDIQAEQDEESQDEGGDESDTEGGTGTVDSSSSTQDDSSEETQEFTLELTDDESAKSDNADHETSDDSIEKESKEFSADDFLNDYLSEKSSSNQAEDESNQNAQQTTEQQQSETQEDTPGDVDDVKMDIDEKVKSLKSPQALDTLLSLAETYMAMEDWQSAKQSLEEVFECGTEEQKQKAQELLKKLDGKD